MNRQETKYWLRLTRTCNNQCIFCLDSGNHNGEFFNYNKLCQKIRKAYNSKTDTKQRIILSGGEPTIHPDYLDIIAYSKQAGFDKVQTITNGRMFYYKKFAKLTKNNGLDEVTFSLHGHNDELHDKLTGITGSFYQSVEGLKNALALDFIVNVDIVVNKMNYLYLFDIVQFFHEIGVSEFDLLTIMPYGRAWDENFNQLFYDLAELKPIFEKVLNYGQQNDLVIWFNRFPVSYFEDHENFLKDIDKKLYYEIFSERQKWFERFIDKGKQLKCLDLKRCQYCFLHDFCAKLFYFNNLIKQNKIEVEIFKTPFCLSRNNYQKVSLKKIISKGKIDLSKFYHFYIKNLHQYKSVRCQKCYKKYECRGLSYEDIKKKGFKILKPVKK